MKSSEFHRLIRSAGWKVVRQRGSHIIYEKEGMMVCVPFHANKEMPTGLVQKLKRQMGI